MDLKLYRTINKTEGYAFGTTSTENIHVFCAPPLRKCDEIVPAQNVIPRSKNWALEVLKQLYPNLGAEFGIAHQVW